MSQHLDVVRRLYEAVAEQDHAAIRDCLAEDVHWQQAGHAVPAAGRAMRGADALIERVIQPFENDWDGFTEPIDKLIDAEPHVIATGTYGGTYRPTGRSLEAEFCHLWTVADGAIQAFRQFTDTAAFAVVMDR